MNRSGRDSAEAGFTLIEILLVMIILGILATIAIMASGVFVSDSKSVACTSNAKILNTAEAAYTAQHPGEFAHGDESKLIQYIRDPMPTDGPGAVMWDGPSNHWVCSNA